MSTERTIYEKQKTYLINICNLAGFDISKWKISPAITEKRKKGYRLFLIPYPYAYQRTAIRTSMPDLPALLSLVGGKLDTGDFDSPWPSACWIGFPEDENEILDDNH